MQFRFRSISVVLAIHLASCASPKPPPPPTAKATRPTSSSLTPTLRAQLIIDRVDVKSHPQKGPWFVCAHATAGDAKVRFNLPDRQYRGDEVSLDMGLQISPIEIGAPVQFALHLDGTAESVCGTAAKDQSLTVFAAGTGVTTVQKDKFDYTIHYHMHYRMN